MIAYLKNVNELKAQEEQQKMAVQEALRLAEEANAARGDFLSRMPHDIRTPMNAIMGMTANAYTSDVEDALHAGMNFHVAKPIDMERLFQLLREYYVKCDSGSADEGQ